MKKQALNLSSLKLTKLSFFQLKKIKGGGEEGYPEYDVIEGDEGNP